MFEVASKCGIYIIAYLFPLAWNKKLEITYLDSSALRNVNTQAYCNGQLVFQIAMKK